MSSVVESGAQILGNESAVISMSIVCLLSWSRTRSHRRISTWSLPNVFRFNTLDLSGLRLKLSSMRPLHMYAGFHCPSNFVRESQLRLHKPLSSLFEKDCKCISFQITHCCYGLVDCTDVTFPI